jgi:hypothetical protein
MLEVKKTFPVWSFMTESSISTEMKEKYWRILERYGKPLLEKYAWGIPDERSLKILQFFSPIVEIGCGKGCVENMLRQLGIIR